MDFGGVSVRLSKEGKCWCRVPSTHGGVLGGGWHLGGQTERVIEVFEFPRLFLAKKNSPFNVSPVLAVVGGKSHQALGPSPQQRGNLVPKWSFWSCLGTTRANYFLSEGEEKREETKQQQVLFPNIGLRDAKGKGISEANRAFPSS